ncbi:ribonuclease H-like domain-containing protein [Tanacetum coccineum]
MTHPLPKGNFVPKAVLMKSGIKILNIVGQNFSKVAVSVNTARPINTAYPRPTVNSARIASNVFNRAHSHVRRLFNKSTKNKNSNLKEKVKTVKGNVTTAGQNAVVGDNKGYETNVLELQEKGVIDSGCSRHMTGNKSYLLDYEEIDGGFIAFRGDPKGKISTGKLDFEDVYFVKEIKFNLFSVSQMCDKKNNVLFTNTECVVLFPGFKLLGENHVLLRVPRKDNMYSNDLKNIVPSGGLTCLFAKATLDESNLWHRRLGHINFKTLNKLVRGNLVRCLPSKIFENNTHVLLVRKESNIKPLGVSYHDLTSKTPYELFLGRKHALSFMRPFGCPVTILNTLDHLEMEIIAFYIDASVIGNQNNGMKIKILLMLDVNIWGGGQSLNLSFQENEKVRSMVYVDPNHAYLEEIVNFDDDEEVGVEADMNNLATTVPVSPIPTTRVHKDHPLEQIIGDIHSEPHNRLDDNDGLNISRTLKGVHNKEDERELLWLETSAKAGSTWTSVNKRSHRRSIKNLLDKFSPAQKPLSPPIQSIRFSMLAGSLNQNVPKWNGK